VGVYSRERISPWGEIRAVTILVPPKSTARTGLPAADSAITKRIIVPKGEGDQLGVWANKTLAVDVFPMADFDDPDTEFLILN
jgi:hypothetical protein